MHTQQPSPHPPPTLSPPPFVPRRAVRTRTFVAVGQETATGGGHTNDRANLLLNMELGGMSTWHRSDQVGPPSLPYIDGLHEFHIDRVLFQH